MRQDTLETLKQYVNEKIPPGGFLTAVLENNLMEAMSRADEGNLVALHEICRYIHNHVPTICYGSPAKVRRWLNSLRVTQDDVGRWVEYLPTHVVGRLKSFNRSNAFVVFHCDNNWDDFQNYTGESCDLFDLKFTEDPR